MFVCVVLLALRADRPGWAVPAGFLAGALRPTGVALAVPAAVELAQRWRRWTPAERLAGAAAVAAPPAGTAAFLWWAGHAFGDALAPLRAQTRPGLRGGVAHDPFTTVVQAVRGLLSGSPADATLLLHLPWIAVAVLLLVAGRRRLPASFTAFAGTMVAVGLTAPGFASFERYAAAGLPLLVTAAALLDTPRRRRVAAVLGAACLVGYSLVAFLHWYVP
ncbi:hypothetical protein [Nakamurella endophytica]|uniref:Uncharacterized protein n=1 Tax=Nakamurella endophytica TaxID=1748367 RepID=A0A917WAV3_9ACTN|nr:hypothetical protein [Nakamurella endophytica]GGL85456.1 hypothetical protein GCM10011594_01390 [Nakamurella endophytica]